MRTVVGLFWVIFLFAMAAVVSTAQAATRFEVKQMIVEEASYSSVPVPLALAVAKVESDFNARALSSAGARGVMQIMPRTAETEFGVDAHDLWDARTNVRLGLRFLERLHDQYGGRWEFALSHYNGGTIKGNRPHKRTRKYVALVQKWQGIYGEQAEIWLARPMEQDVKDDRGRADVSLKPWQERGVEDAPFYDEDPVPTRIIVVERSDRFDPRLHRPPPRGRWGRGGFRRGPPGPPHFH